MKLLTSVLVAAILVGSLATSLYECQRIESPYDILVETSEGRCPPGYVEVPLDHPGHGIIHRHPGRHHHGHGHRHHGIHHGHGRGHGHRHGIAHGHGHGHGRRGHGLGHGVGHVHGHGRRGHGVEHGHGHGHRHGHGRRGHGIEHGHGHGHGRRGDGQGRRGHGVEHGHGHGHGRRGDGHGRRGHGVEHGHGHGHGRRGHGRGHGHAGRGEREHHRQPQAPKRGPATEAIVSEHIHWGGRQLPFKKAVPDLAAHNFDKTASGVRIRGGPWVLCAGKYFKADCWTFPPGDYANFLDFDWNDELSSLQPGSWAPLITNKRKFTSRADLYTGKRFNGQRVRFWGAGGAYKAKKGRPVINSLVIEGPGKYRVFGQAGNVQVLGKGRYDRSRLRSLGLKGIIKVTTV